MKERVYAVIACAARWLGAKFDDLYNWADRKHALSLATEDFSPEELAVLSKHADEWAQPARTEFLAGKLAPLLTHEEVGVIIHSSASAEECAKRLQVAELEKLNLATPEPLSSLELTQRAVDSAFAKHPFEPLTEWSVPLRPMPKLDWDEPDEGKLYEGKPNDVLDGYLG